jgi:hypothetical protein
MPAALLGVPSTGLVQIVLQPLKLLPMGRREISGIEIGETICRGVVFRPKKMGVVRDGNPAPTQEVPHPGVIQHGGDRPGVRPTPIASTGAAVIGGRVRIIFRG